MIDIILEKAEEFDRVIQEKHTLDGLVLPTLVTDSELEIGPYSGNHENDTIWTGLYATAKAFEYAVTNDPKARELAKKSILALHKAQDITLKPGLVARGYKIADKATWDEAFFWIKTGKNLGHSELRAFEDYEDSAKALDFLFGYRRKNEWNQGEEEFERYRWLGDPSKSQIFGVMFAYFTFDKFCNPDEEEKAEIKRHLCDIVDRIIDNDMTIVGADSEMTGYGNYKARSGKDDRGIKKTLNWFREAYGNLGPFLILSHLKLAYKMSGDERYQRKYEELLYGESHTRFLGKSRISIPLINNILTTGSDDNLAMLNNYLFMSLEDDPHLISICAQGLGDRWRRIRDPENALFNFIYHALVGSGEDHKIGADALSKFPKEKSVPLISLKRKQKTLQSLTARETVHIENRMVDEYMWRVNPFRRSEWNTPKT